MVLSSGNYFEKEEAAFRARLAQACRFSESDLAANRQGKLTSSQKGLLLEVALAPLWKMLAVLLGLVAFSTSFRHFEPPANIGALMVAGEVGIVALFFGLVAFLIKFLLASGRAWNLLFDLASSRVTSVVGRLTASKGEEVAELESALAKSRYSRSYGRGPIVVQDYPINGGVPQKTEVFSFVVKGEYFEVPREAYLAMRDRDGTSYRVYITPRSRYLVALESTIGDPTLPDPFKLRQATPVSSHL